MQKVDRLQPFRALIPLALATGPGQYLLARNMWSDMEDIRSVLIIVNLIIRSCKMLKQPVYPRHDDDAQIERVTASQR